MTPPERRLHKKHPAAPSTETTTWNKAITRLPSTSDPGAGLLYSALHLLSATLADSTCPIPVRRQ